MATENPSTDLTNEEWRPVEGWPYEVSSLGRVRRSSRGRTTSVGRVLKPCRIGARRLYLAVMLYRSIGDPHVQRMIIHRLVCAAFHGPAPTPKHEVAHWDGDSTNNETGNLRWATSAENSQDMRRHGRTTCGERQWMHKLTEEQVRDIRAALLRRDETQTKIAARFGVAKMTISDIKRNRTWCHLLG